MKNYYQILGISRNASTAEIKKAYRALAYTYHPDKNKEPQAVARFIEITEAYDFLMLYHQTINIEYTSFEPIYHPTEHHTTSSTTSEKNYGHIYEAPSDPEEYQEWLKAVKKRAQENLKKGKIKKNSEKQKYKTFIKYYMNPLMITVSLLALIYLMDIVLPYKMLIEHVYEASAVEDFSDEKGYYTKISITTSNAKITVDDSEVNYVLENFHTDKVSVYHSFLFNHPVKYSIKNDNKVLSNNTGFISQLYVWHIITILICIANLRFKKYLTLNYFFCSVLIIDGLSYLIFFVPNLVNL